MTRTEHIFRWKTSDLPWREYAQANSIPEKDDSYRDDPVLLPTRHYPVSLSHWWTTQSCQDAFAREAAPKTKPIAPKLPTASDTAIAAARDHCASYQSDGTCLGVDLGFKRFRKEGSPCALRRCEACLYFEECVLPQVLPDVSEDYLRSLPPGVTTSVRPQGAIRRCPDCGKSALKSRQRACDSCRQKRRRKTWVTQKAKTALKLPTVNAISSCVSASESTPQISAKPEPV